MQRIRILCVGIVCVFSNSTAWAFPAADSLFPLGMNWMKCDPLLDSGRTKTLFDSIIGCTMYHDASNIDSVRVHPTDSAHSALAWSRNSNAQFVYGNYDHPIYLYSGARRIPYDAVDVPSSGSDPLLHYQFSGRAAIGDTVSAFGVKYWRAREDSTRTYLNTRLIWGNEFSREWRANGNNAIRLYIAVRMHVANVDTSSTYNAITVEVIHVRGATRDTFVANVPWKTFKNTNDLLWLSDSAIGAISSFTYNSDSLNVEVWGERHVTVYLSSITVEDERARDLLSADDFGGGNATWNSRASAIADSVLLDSASINDHVQKPGGGSSIKYVYMMDEPPVSEYSCMGKIEYFLNGRGITELGGPNNRRFVEWVHPKVLWSGGFNAGAYQVSAVFDSGPGEGNVVAHDNGGTYKDSTLDTYHFPEWGYFPYASGSYTSHQTYAMRSSSDAAGFDDFDLREGGFITVVLTNSILHGAWADSVVTLDTSGIGGAPTEWWANVFAHEHINLSNRSLSWYLGSGPPPPEQIRAATGVSLGMGCKGLMFYTGPTLFCDVAPPDSEFCLGFVRENGKHDSNSTTYNGHILPTLYKNRTNSLIAFAKWLRTYGYPLHQATWLGAFTRHTYEVTNPDGTFSHVGDTSVVYGTNTMVDTAADSSLRPILNSWPADGTAHARVLSGDTLVTETPLARTQSMILEGFFADAASTPARPVKLLTVCNLYADPRDLLARYDPEDSVSVKRGDRRIRTTLMNLDTAISKYYRVSVLDSTHWDTVLAASSPVFWQHYGPGEMRLFRIEPAYSYTSGLADDTRWNNGRRSEYNGNYHSVFARGGHVYYSRSNATTVGAEPLSGFANQRLDTLCDSAKHPSIRSVDDTLAVVYEALEDTLTQIHIKINAANGAAGYWFDTVMYSFRTGSGFEATPVVCPMDFECGGCDVNPVSIRGFIVAWSEGAAGIGLRAYETANTHLTQCLTVH